MYISRRNNHYYLRVRIPLDVQQHFHGKCEIKRALHTDRYSHAKRLAACFKGKLEEVYTLIRTGILNEEMIQRLVKKHLDTSIKLFERAIQRGEVTTGFYQKLDDINSTEEGYDALVTTHEKGIQASSRLLGRRQSASMPYIVKTANLLLRMEGINAIHEEDLDNFCRQLHMADLQADQVNLEHLKGNFDTDYDKEERDKPKTDLLSTVITSYLSVNRDSIGAKRNTEDQIYKIIDCLKEETGNSDIELSAINRPLIEKITARLANYPDRRFIRYKHKTLAEIDLLPCVVRTKPETAKKSIMTLQSIIERANTQFVGLDKHYAAGIVRELAPKSDTLEKKREKFYPEDLAEIIATLELFKNKGEFAHNLHLLLIPLIALFQGMRQNEICQLRVSDINQVNDIWCISINEEVDSEGGKSVKTKKSSRIIPIHPKLVEIGLLRFWDSQKRKQRVRLWEGETKISCAMGSDGKHNKLFCQWFSRTFKPKIKLQTSRITKQVFHSFRHTFCDYYNQNFDKFDRAAVSALVGHLDKADKEFLLTNTETFGGSYSHDLVTSRLYTTLCQLDYDINISGLII